MRLACVGCLVFSSLLAARTPGDDPNVNTRYKVETVIVSGKGWSTNFASASASKISPSLGKRITALIGSQLNPSALDDVTRRLRKELQANVTRRVERGDSPDLVRVVYQVGERTHSFDGSVTKFTYDSRDGWSGAAQTSIEKAQNNFTFGLVSDGDDFAERFAGIMARYDNARLGTDRLRLRFEFDSYHDQWNGATLVALPATLPQSPELELTSMPYRSRQNFAPAVVFDLTDAITMTAGVGFERFDNVYPAAHTEAANAVTAAVRYDKRLGASEVEQCFDAGYDLRAATKVLSSDFVYSRHKGSFRYTLTSGKHMLRDEFTMGSIDGRAPLDDRFYLGNSRTLRGWSMYEIDPLGGNRMVHNSVEYRYSAFEVFYDAGAVWDEGETVATPRQGLGLGLRHGPFEMALAFPLRSGRADPTFIMGMNY